jgi:hypothetical protein
MPISFPFTECPLEKTAELLLHLTPEQIHEQAPAANLDQIRIIIRTLNEDKDTHWKEKLCAIFAAIHELPQLEVVGQELTLSQALILLDFTHKNDPSLHWKFSPMLVGMPHELFSNLLLSASSQQMEVLKQEVVAEPIQLRLTIFLHDIQRHLVRLVDSIVLLEQTIGATDLTHLGDVELADLSKEIPSLRRSYQTLAKKIQKGLTLAWNSNRTNLVEKFSLANEHCNKLHALIEEGVVSKLESKLLSIYGSPENPTDNEALEDDDPALEALAKLSIWYLKDYFEGIRRKSG